MGYFEVSAATIYLIFAEVAIRGFWKPARPARDVYGFDHQQVGHVQMAGCENQYTVIIIHRVVGRVSHDNIFEKADSMSDALAMLQQTGQNISE